MQPWKALGTDIHITCGRLLIDCPLFLKVPHCQTNYGKMDTQYSYPKQQHHYHSYQFTTPEGTVEPFIDNQRHFKE